MNRFLIVFFLSIFLFRCKPSDPVKASSGKGLAGTWLFSETGYSPGSGYIIDKVSATPKQTLTFTADGHMKAQGDGLIYYQSFTQYHLDTLNSLIRIHFSPSVPDHFDILYLKSDTLRLYQTQCIEGCHFGFYRIGDGS